MAENHNQTPSSSKSGSSNRGFGSMDENKQRDIASKGGQSVPDEERSFSKDPELASEAGKKGGEARQSSGSSSGSRSDEQPGSGRGSGGNFANDPERASEAGRKGGQR